MVPPVIRKVPASETPPRLPDMTPPLISPSDELAERPLALLSFDVEELPEILPPVISNTPCELKLTPPMYFAVLSAITPPVMYKLPSVTYIAPP